MFNDLLVLELASVLAGPDVGMFFSELGAKVIKVENKVTGGDVTRKWKSASEDPDTLVSAYFSAVNWNKKSVFLNLKSESDQHEVYQLVKKADVVITNFKPGDDQKLKMDYQTLKSINPTIIYGEINGYGSLSTRPAYDVVLQAETGFMSMNGSPQSGPLKMPIALIDVLAAHQLKEGLLVALLKKNKTNVGSKVEVSLYDAALASLKNQATNWLMNREVPQLLGSLHPNIAPYGETFLTKDHKRIVLAIGSDRQFNKLLAIIGASSLIEKQIYQSNQLRVQHRKELAEDLTPYFKLHTSTSLMQELVNEKVPAGAIHSIDEVFENEAAQQLILEEDMNGVQTKRVKTAIFKIS